MNWNKDSDVFLFLDIIRKYFCKLLFCIKFINTSIILCYNFPKSKMYKTAIDKILNDNNYHKYHQHTVTTLLRNSRHLNFAQRPP